MSAKTTKEAFAKAARNSAQVDIDGVGKITIRELSLADLDSVDQTGGADARAKNLALAIYDEAGLERIFDPENDDDVAVIKGLGMRNINKMTSALTEKN